MREKEQMKKKKSHRMEKWGEKESSIQRRRKEDKEEEIDEVEEKGKKLSEGRSGKAAECDLQGAQVQLILFPHQILLPVRQSDSDPTSHPWIQIRDWHRQVHNQ